MNKILITAFEPFGPIGKYVRGENSSEIILEKIKKEHQDDFLFLTLPVSKEGITQMQNALAQHNPIGILSMGEDMLAPPSQVKIEPYAYQADASIIPFLDRTFSGKLQSEFVNHIGNGQDSSSIGHYYCNDIYRTGLNWAKDNGSPPVAFIHTPVFGDHDRHAQNILKTLNDMKEYTQQHQDLDMSYE